jgi:anti-sigma factor RsiW
MMRDCADGAMRDRLPDFVHETLSAREHAAVAAHVAACADCADEVALIRSVRAAYPVPAVDMSRVVASLPSAPGIARTMTPRWSAREWMIAAAASFVLIIGTTVIALRGDMRGGLPGTGKGAAVGTHRSSVRPAGFSVGGTSELSADQLRALLNEIDSVSVLPSTEPEPARRPQIFPQWEVIN